MNDLALASIPKRGAHTIKGTCPECKKVLRVNNLAIHIRAHSKRGEISDESKALLDKFEKPMKGSGGRSRHSRSVKISSQYKKCPICDEFIHSPKMLFHFTSHFKDGTMPQSFIPKYEYLKEQHAYRLNQNGIIGVIPDSHSDKVVATSDSLLFVNKQGGDAMLPPSFDVGFLINKAREIMSTRDGEVTTVAFNFVKELSLSNPL